MVDWGARSGVKRAVHLFFLLLQKVIRPPSQRYLRVMRIAEKGLEVYEREVDPFICSRLK